MCWWRQKPGNIGGGFKPLTGGSARAPPIRLQNEVTWMRDSLKAWLTSQRQTRSYRTVKTQVKTHCFMVPYAMVTSRTLKFARSHVVALLSTTNNLEVQWDWRYGQLFTYRTVTQDTKWSESIKQGHYKRKGQPRQLVGVEIYTSKL